MDLGKANEIRKPRPVTGQTQNNSKVYKVNVKKSYKKEGAKKQWGKRMRGTE